MTDNDFRTLSVTDVSELDAVCDAFERDWQSGQSPRIEERLWPTTRSARWALLSELLAIELELLRRAGGTPQLEDYLRRFPDDAELVRGVFESATTPQADGSITIAPAAKRRGLNVGHRIGQYRLVKRIGGGGMGVVFQAVHVALEKTVAVKVLKSEAVQDSRAIERFRREIKAIGQVAHPHIVTAFDAGDSDGRPYLVMEFIEGIDLSRLVKISGPLPIADACEVARQAASALQCIDEHGAVHRDVKPSNLMLASSRSGGIGKGDSQLRSATIKLLDLGLARLCDPGATHTALTSTGSVFGTADYIAPEQFADSHTVDIRADIYSLGCALYHLLCGHAPYSDNEKYSGPIKKMMAHEEDPIPPIADQRAGVPAKLVAVLDRMLAKKPDQRYAKPKDVIDALLPFCVGSNLTRLLEKTRSAENADAGDGLSDVCLLPNPVPPDPVREIQTPGEEAGNQDNYLPTVIVSRSDSAVTVFDELPRTASLRWSRRKRTTLIGIPLLLCGVIAIAMLSVFGDKTKLNNSDAVKKIEVTQEGTPSNTTDLQPNPAEPNKSKTAELDAGVAEAQAQMSPLDKLDAANIAAIHREPGMPSDVVAVLSDTRWRHWANITQVAISPDGKFVASGDERGVIRMWDVATKLPKYHWQAYSRPVRGLAFSPDSQTLASGSETLYEAVHLWDLATGASQALVTWRSVPPVNPPADAKPESLTRTFQPEAVNIQNLRFNRDGTSLIGVLTANNQPLSTMVQWDVATRRERTRIETGLQDVKLSFNGDRLAGTDPTTKLVRVWDVRLQEPLVLPDGWKVTGPVYDVTDDDQLLADEKCSLWSTTTGERLGEFNDQNAGGRIARFVGQSRVVSSNANPVGMIWNRATYQEAARFGQPSQGWIRTLAHSRDGSLIVTGTDDRTVRLRDAQSGEETVLLDALPQGAVARDAKFNVGGWSLAFAPDGSRAAIGSVHGNVVVWNLSNLSVEQDIVVESAAINGVVFSPDSKRFASVSRSFTRLWDSETGKPIGDQLFYDAKSGGARCLFAKGGSALIQTAEGQIQSWDLATSKLVEVVPAKQDGLVTEIAGSANGNILAMIAGRKVKTWDASTGKLLDDFVGHGDQPVNAVDVSPDGKTVASIAQDGVIRLWDIARKRERLVLRGHNAPGAGLSFSSNGERLVSASSNGQVIVWDATATEVLPAKLHEWQFPGGVPRAYFAPDGRHVATLNDNGTTWILRLSQQRTRSTDNPVRVVVKDDLEKPDRIVRATKEGEDTDRIVRATKTKTKTKTEVDHPPLATGALVARPAKLPGVRSWSIETKAHRGTVSSVAYSPDGKWLATACDDGALRLWQADTLQLDRVFLGHEDTIHKVAWSPDSRFVATASEDTTVRIWDVSTNKLSNVLSGHSAAVVQLAWDHKGKTLASRVRGGTLYLWDTAGPRLLQKLQTIDYRYGRGLSWSSDDRRLVITYGYATLGIWNRSTAQLESFRSQNAFHDLSCSPDQPQHVVVAGQPGVGSIELWDSLTKQKVREFAQPLAGATVAWTRQGMVAGGGYFGDPIRIWDSASGKVIREMPAPQHFGPNASLLSLCFNPDDSRLIAAGSNMGIDVYDLSALQVRQRPLHKPRLNTVLQREWSPDGQQFATATLDGTVRIWSRDGAIVNVFSVPGAHRLAWSPDGNCLAVAYDSGKVALLELGDNIPADQRQREVQLRGVYETSLSWCSDSNTLVATLRSDGPIAVIDRATAKVREEIPRQPAKHDTFAVNVSPDNLHVACVEGNSDLQIINLATKSLVLVYDGPDTQLSTCAWSPDGRIIATAGSDGLIRLFDVSRREPLAPIRASQQPPAPIKSLAWSGDGKSLLSTSTDRMTRTWNVETGQLIRAVPGPPSATFSVDTEHKLTLNNNRSLFYWSELLGPDGAFARVFDTATGEPQITVVPLRDDVWLTLIPDGHHRGSRRIDEEIVYVVELDDGSQATLTPAEFTKQFGWK